MTGTAKKEEYCATITDVPPASALFPAPADAAAAIALQQELRKQVRLENEFGPIDTLAGVDVGFDIVNNNTRACIALFDANTRELIGSARAVVPTVFPYIPGLLSFREIPALLEAFAALPRMPDMLMVDGQGVAHPRRLGIAAHLGVILDIPSLGVAKKKLCGAFTPPDEIKGAHTPLTHRGELIGNVLRSKIKCNPLFISAGHRMEQDTALRIAREWLTTYRLPEPTRIADQMSKWPV